MFGKIPMDAESFEAQTKLTDYTRGKDWEGKPYTGQIFPDHPDLDPELADRNQDGKMASWERAIGNQVAKGKSRFKAPRKMTKTTTKFHSKKTYYCRIFITSLCNSRWRISDHLRAKR